MDDIVAEAKYGIVDWMRFYDTRRRHQKLDNQTPVPVRFAGRTYRSRLAPIRGWRTSTHVQESESRPIGEKRVAHPA